MLIHAVAAHANAVDADAIMVDGGGVGGGVVDGLIDLGFNVYDVQFGASPDGFHDGVRYSNKRTEIWGLMREALSTLSILDRPPGAAQSLVDELTAPNYTMKGTNQTVIELESKESMKRRQVVSPDYADALALTFSYPIVKQSRIPAKPEPAYNPYSPENIYNEIVA